jgi:hypothetical protein
MIDDVIYSIESAPRLGAEKDFPEGTRYIIVSDTLAREWVYTLEEAKAEIEEMKPEQGFFMVGLVTGVLLIVGIYMFALA